MSAGLDEIGTASKGEQIREAHDTLAAAELADARKALDAAYDSNAQRYLAGERADSGSVANAHAALVELEGTMTGLLRLAARADFEDLERELLASEEALKPLELRLKMAQLELRDAKATYTAMPPAPVGQFQITLGEFYFQKEQAERAARGKVDFARTLVTTLRTKRHKLLSAGDAS